MLSTVDAWSASKAVTRSEAIRRLVELGLKVKGK
jgi:metal-responsive CopG/Arc/MetJ family transcriptional regulator